MDQHDIVRLGGQSGQGVGNRFLAVVAAFDDLHAAGKALTGRVLSHLSLYAFHLRFAHGDVDGRHPLDRCKGAQRVDQDGQAVELEELLGLRAGHSSAESRGGENCENLHNG